MLEGDRCENTFVNSEYWKINPAAADESLPGMAAISELFSGELSKQSVDVTIKFV